MASLGKFGKEIPTHEVESDTFDYFGETITVHPLLTDVVFIDFVEIANSISEENVVAGMVAVKELLRRVIDDTSFDLFWETGNKNRQNLEARMVVAQEVFAAVADRPTVLSTDSSDGPTPTLITSVDGSPSQVITPFAGRPDLQLVVAQVAEARGQVAAAG